MSETKKKYREKNLIHITEAQKEAMAKAAHAKVQSYVNELNQIQARRFETSVGLLIAQVTRNGVDGITAAEVEACRSAASLLVDADAKQKWSELRDAFVELGLHDPQPPLEWAAAKVGVTLITPLPEAPESPIIDPATEDMASLTKVIQ